MGIVEIPQDREDKPRTCEEILGSLPDIPHTGSYKQREILRPTDGMKPKRQAEEKEEKKKDKSSNN